MAAQAGQRVHLVDIDADAVSKAQKRINESIQRVAKRKFKVKVFILEFITCTVKNLSMRLKV